MKKTRFEFHVEHSDELDIAGLEKSIEHGLERLWDAWPMVNLESGVHAIASFAEAEEARNEAILPELSGPQIAMALCKCFQYHETPEQKLEASIGLAATLLALTPSTSIAFCVLADTWRDVKDANRDEDGGS